MGPYYTFQSQTNSNASPQPRDFYPLLPRLHRNKKCEPCCCCRCSCTCLTNLGRSPNRSCQAADPKVHAPFCHFANVPICAFLPTSTPFDSNQVCAYITHLLSGRDVRYVPWRHIQYLEICISSKDSYLCGVVITCHSHVCLCAHAGWDHGSQCIVLRDILKKIKKPKSLV